MLHLILLELRRHAVRTVLSITGIAIAVATIVALQSVSTGIERSASGLIHLGGSELGLFQGGVGDLTASTLPESMVDRVKHQPGVADAAPIAVAGGELHASGSFLVFGVDPRSFVVRRLVFLAGRGLRSPGEAILGDGAARQLGLGVGDRLTLASGTLAIVGVYHAGVPFEDQGAGLLLGAVQRILGRPGDVTTIGVSLAPGARASQVGPELERSFQGTVAISQPGEVARVDTNSLLIRKASVVFVALALLIGGIVIANTMLMAAFERRHDFALLLAIGWPRRLLAGLILREGVLLSLIGALIGLVLGAVGGTVIVHLFGASGLISPQLRAWMLARAVLIATAVGALGSVYPALLVTRLRPAEVL
jgi:putative ABC transport system permease protein